MEIIDDLKNVDKQIEKFINKDKNTVNENANKDSNTFITQRDLIAGQVAKAKGLSMLPDDVVTAHVNGDIHFHDLNVSPFTPMTNCSLLDIQSMFKSGFKMGNAEVETPKSIGTAVAQMTQVILSVAGHQFGGISIDNIDKVLAPYAEMNYNKHKEDMEKWKIEDEDYAKEKTKKDIYDSIQGLEYEVNTLCSSQGQVPFITIGFGRGINWFEREVQKAILNVRLKGLGKEGRTAIFPKQIFIVEDGVNLRETDPNYDIKQLAIECCSKRMYPDFLSTKMIKEITGSVKSPMGCRSFLASWKNEHGEEVTDGRMNLGVVTINLPRIALESKDKAEFIKILNKKMVIVRKALEARIESVCSAEPKNAPILYKEGAWGKKLTDKDKVSELFLNKRASISLGYIGLYEVGTRFYGSEWENNPEAKAFTLDLLKRLKDYCELWSDVWDIGCSVYSTPSESLTHRLCKLDTEKFGVIKDITDKDYYTNSFHYDVRKKVTPFEKIEFEKEYPFFANGGFIHFVETANLQQNPKALEAIWDFAYDKIGYLGVNSPIDKCYECGFEGDFNSTESGHECPTCGNNNPETADVVKRLCGYLGNPLARPVVHGRHKEIQSRTKHI